MIPPKTAILAAGLLGAVGLAIWPGCATPPLPSSHKPIAARQTADLDFLKGAHPQRFEVINRLGKPDTILPELRVSCYRLNLITRRRLWLFLGVLPIAAPRDPDRVEVAFLHYEEERVQRFTIRTIPDRISSLRAAAAEWLRKETGSQAKETPLRPQ